jgi:hypothetical protein
MVLFSCSGQSLRLVSTHSKGICKPVAHSTARETKAHCSEDFLFIFITICGQTLFPACVLRTMPRMFLVTFHVSKANLVCHEFGT